MIAGYGLVLGSALGLLIGTMFTVGWPGPIIGAAIGLIVGAAIDAQRRKKTPE